MRRGAGHRRCGRPARAAGGALHGAQDRLYGVELHGVAGEGHLVLGPQAADKVQVVQEAAQTCLTGHAEGVELRVAVAESGADGEASAAHDVQRGQFLSDVDRVVQRHECDGRAEPHLAGLGDDAGQHGERVQVLEGVGEVVLRRPDRGEAGIACEADLFDLFCEARHHVVVGGELAAQHQPVSGCRSHLR